MKNTTNSTMGTMLNKVPEVTLIFWLIKIMATTVGETGADFLSSTLNLGLVNTSYVMCVLFFAALFFQLRSKRYIPTLYWLVVILISIMGTLISDNLAENLGVSLVTTSLAFVTLLLTTFWLWYRSEHTLSVHTIFTTKRELFYWAAILFTFALGTSAGDLLSERLGLGYAISGLLFLSAIAVVYFSYRYAKWSEVLAFWLAYILTRPLGASIGDLLTSARADGGFAIGTTPINVIFGIAIVVAVAYLTRTANREYAEQLLSPVELPAEDSI